MAKALVDQYTKEELAKIVQLSKSYKEVIQRLGYGTSSGRNNITVQKRIELYNIDTSHFATKKPIKRCPENIFIENSTASQKVMREWYLKGEYTPYQCSICGQQPFWREQPLTLILDHINGCNKDHRLENLRWVCPNCNQQLDTTGYKKIRTDNKPHKHNYCIDCGEEILLTSSRCKSCADKMRRIANKEIVREELKSLIRTHSFVKIGELYGISDNAVRKWCDKFNLPRRKTDIQNYTDEEWEKI